MRRNNRKIPNSPKPRLSASQEDYLEAIYWLSRQHGVARATHIARQVNVGKSSVTAALRQLADKGHINYDPYQLITLTPSGETLAKDVVQRHEILKRFLMEILGVENELAGKTACGMEHSIDREVLNRLLRFVQLFNKHNVKKTPWAESFNSTCKHGRPTCLCKECSEMAEQDNSYA
jgi:DtxR family Mn-dependent transcriptional regulator